MSSGAGTPPRPRFPARIDTGAGTPAVQVRRPPVDQSMVQTTARPVVARGMSPAPASAIGPSGDLVAVRAGMVRRLAAQGIASAPVLQAMGAVERHRFVDSGLTGQAYEDTSLPIGLGQTISKPSVVARMAELLLGSELGRAGPLGRVLEIGTGCGYQAAVLAQVAREVYSIERLRGLHERAQANLRPYRIANVHLLLGDGAIGYAAGAPYAGIVAAAAGSEVPQAWLDQLAVGARLVAPVTQADGSQALLVVDRTAQSLRQSQLESVHFVPLKSGIA